MKGLVKTGGEKAHSFFLFLGGGVHQGEDRIEFGKIDCELRTVHFICKGDIVVWLAWLACGATVTIQLKAVQL